MVPPDRFRLRHIPVRNRRRARRRDLRMARRIQVEALAQRLVAMAARRRHDYDTHERVGDIRLARAGLPSIGRAGEAD